MDLTAGRFLFLSLSPLPNPQYQRDIVETDHSSDSVAEFLPGFEGRVRKALVVLLGADGEKRVRMGLAKDGSGVGAALTALQAKKALDKRMGTKTVKGSADATGRTGGKASATH